MIEFVTKDIAIHLKKKGFKEECIKHYRPNNNRLINNEYDLINKSIYKSYNTIEDKKLKDYIDAPSITQALIWIRKYKNIHIVTNITEKGYIYEIFEIIDNRYKGECIDISYDTFDSPEISAIEAINNLITKYIL